jgi:hypothetical protein
MTGGSFPTGVTGKATGSAYTISGAPTIIGKYVYSLTAVASGCRSTASAGTITVTGDFYSASTWSIYGHTWSDRVHVQSACALVNVLSEEDDPPPQWTSGLNNSSLPTQWVNRACALIACPAGWHYPTRNDCLEWLRNSNWSPPDAWIPAGYLIGATRYEPALGYLHGRTTEATAYYWDGTSIRWLVNAPAHAGYELRCVKDE